MLTDGPTLEIREMFDRRDKFARDNIPQLEKRIQANEQKLQAIKAKGSAAKEGEEGKVADAIVKVGRISFLLYIRMVPADVFELGQAKYSGPVGCSNSSKHTQLIYHSTDGIDYLHTYAC